MPIWSLTKERVEKLLKQIGDVESTIDALIKLSKEDIWKRDLEDFINEWRVQLEDERKTQRKVANMGRRASNKLKIEAKAPGRKRKNNSDDSDSEFASVAAPKNKKTSGPKNSKPVGGMLSYLNPNLPSGDKPKKPTKAKATSATANSAQEMLNLLTKKEPDVIDLASTGDGASDVHAKPSKARAPATTKQNPKIKKTVISENDDEFNEENIRPTARRQPRAATKKPVKYDTFDDSSDGDQMLFDVGNMVKGIDSTAASADNARPLFSASMSRPSSSAGVPKKTASSKQTMDLDEDDTDYTRLAPPTTKKGPTVTARQTILSDEDDDLLSDVVAPVAKPKPALKAVSKPGPKPKPKKPIPVPQMPSKTMPLSPAAKAYAAKKAKTERLAYESDKHFAQSEDEMEKVVNEIIDEDDEDEEPVARPPRRAAAAAPKKKWVVSDDEDDDEEESEDDFDGNDSDE